jgi:excisionase family DNA binding protein
MKEKATLEGVPEEVREMKEDVKQLKEMMFALLTKEEQKANNETWMTVETAAILTNQKEQTVRTKVMKNEMPSHRIDGKRLFKKSEILEWMNRGGGKRYE